MLDHDDAVAGRHQTLQHAQQTGGIVQVQSGGGFVQQVERAPGGAPAELFGQLDALGFAARERGGGLAELQVAQAHVGQHLQARECGRHAFEQRQRLFDRQVKHLRDVVIAVLDLEYFAGEAPAAAGRAAHFHVGHKVHVDGQHAGAFTARAAPAGHVEREVARFQAQAARVRRGGERLADGRERVGVGGGIRARDAPDVRLVDGDDLVEQVDPFDRIVRAGDFARPVQALARGAVEHIEDERGFTRARHAGDRHQQPQRQPSGDVLQVVVARAADGDGFTVRLAPAGRHGDGLSPGEIRAGERAGVGSDLGGRAFGHHLAAVLARAGAKVDHPVGGGDGFQVVLDHQHGVVQVDQPAQHADQAVRVALVQPDGGLVEHVQHPGQARAEQRGQPQPLRLAGREGGGGALAGEIARADFHQT